MHSGAGSSKSLEDMTWCEAEKAFQEASAAILPIGSTEAHGPHLPLQTDLLIAAETARRGAAALAKRGIRAVVLPPVAYGVTFVSSPFPGTVTLTPRTLEGIVRDICVSLAGQGCKYICVSNGHLEPAHLQAILAGARAAMDASDCNVAVPDQREPRWANTLTEEFRQGARHAGSYETSLVMRLGEDLVRGEELARLEPIWIDLPGRLAKGAKTFKEAGSELAYFGDPRQASAEEGEMLYEALGEMIARTVEEMMTCK